MTKIFTKKLDPNKPEINQDNVLNFFKQRAEKIGTISYKQAVIYQDKNPQLAEERDTAEKNLLLPKLELSPKDRFIDIGCGTGRWAEIVIDKVAHYHGTDLVEGFIEFAKINNQQNHANFTCIPCTEITLKALNESKKFNKIIMFGVLIYLNDQSLESALKSVLDVAAEQCTFLLREPIGISNRLTLKEHFSEDLNQTYNAIYRTAEEIMQKCQEILGTSGFEMIETGNVFNNKDLNNRAETMQKYFLFMRKSK